MSGAITGPGVPKKVSLESVIEGLARERDFRFRFVGSTLVKLMRNLLGHKYSRQVTSLSACIRFPPPDFLYKCRMTLIAEVRSRSPRPSIEDVQLLLDYIDSEGITPAESDEKWSHMGAVIADASLQAGVGYKNVVLPRVRALRQAWPDANTTSGLIRRLATGSLPTVLNWKGQKKLAVVDNLAAAFQELGIETTEDLYAAFEDPATREPLIARLRSISGVKNKTVDYLAILVGVDTRVAIDVQLTAFASAAGVESLTYEQLSELYISAAARLGCTPRALDAAVWKYMSGR